MIICKGSLHKFQVSSIKTLVCKFVVPFKTYNRQSVEKPTTGSIDASSSSPSHSAEVLMEHHLDFCHSSIGRKIQKTSEAYVFINFSSFSTNNNM